MALDHYCEACGKFLCATACEYAVVAHLCEDCQAEMDQKQEEERQRMETPVECSVCNETFHRGDGQLKLVDDEWICGNCLAASGRCHICGGPLESSSSICAGCASAAYDLIRSFRTSSFRMGGPGRKLEGHVEHHMPYGRRMTP